MEGSESRNMDSSVSLSILNRKEETFYSFYLEKEISNLNYWFQ